MTTPKARLTTSWFLLIFAVLFHSSATAQVLINLEWQQGNGAPSEIIDYSVSAIAENGCLVVAGNTVTSGEAENFLITKFDPEGQILWEQQYDFSDLTDFATGIAVDAQGNIYVGGASANGNLDFDFALLKLNGNGNLDWSKRYEGPGQGDDYPTALGLDAAGNVYLTGVSLGSGTQQDFATLKYSSSGTLQWEARYDFAGMPDAAAGLLIDEINQQVIVSGISGTGTNDWDIATVRYAKNSGSALSEVRQASGANSYTDPIALAQDTPGNIYVTGTVTNGTDTDIQTIKLDTSLSVQWVETYDSGSLDEGRDVVVDPNGDIYVCGYRQNGEGLAFQLLKYDHAGHLIWEKYRAGESESDSARALFLSYDPTGGGVFVSGEGVPPGESSYLMTLLYDPEGQLIWEKYYDDPSREEVPTDLRANLFGAVYITGKSQGGGNTQYLTQKYEMMPISPQPVMGPTGRASHIANEVLIRFDPGVIDPNFVNNPDLQFGRVDEIITDANLVALMDAKLQANGTLGGWTVSRVFHSLNTQSETMTSIRGVEVELPKLWSTLKLHLPTNVSSVRSTYDEHEVSDSLSTLPLRYIRYAHPNYYAHLAACAPNDPLYSFSQRSIHNFDPVRSHINAEQAWCFLDSANAAKGKPSVRVGIFDTGIDADHPDFTFGGSGFTGSVIDAGHRFLNGSHLTLQYNNTNDPVGHGSKTAGIIAAVRNNGTGIAGIAGGDMGGGEGEGVHLVSIQTFFDDGVGGIYVLLTDITDAFIWSLTAGPNNSPLFAIANHGYGFFLDDLQVNQPNVDLFKEVFQTAFRAEVSSVVSRGNNEGGPPSEASFIPATFTIDSIQEPSLYYDDWNLSVGASDRKGNLAKIWSGNSNNPDPFSSYYGKSVDLIAPGVNAEVLTTGPQGNYENFNATSASAAHVSGVAALLMSYSDVVLAPEDVEHLLQYGAVPKSTMDSTGWGIVDAYASLKLIEQPEYRVIHFDSVLTTPGGGGGFQAAPVPITIRLTSDYDTIEAGIYQAYVYQYLTTFNYDLGTGVSLATLPSNKPPYWIRNSGSRLWGPNGVIVGGSNQYVVPVDHVEFWGPPTANSATVTGYYYELLLSPTESVVIPYGSDSSTRVAFSLLAHNPQGFPTNVENESKLSKEFSLHAFPNPTVGTTTIHYSLPTPSSVRMVLLDLSGRELWSDHLGQQAAGKHIHEISCVSLPSGIYLLRLQAGEKVSYVKLIKQ